MKWINAYFLTCTFLCVTLTPETASGTDRVARLGPDAACCGDLREGAADSPFPEETRPGGGKPCAPGDFYGEDDPLGGNAGSKPSSSPASKTLLQWDGDQGSRPWMEADSLLASGSWFEAAIAYERLYFRSGQPAERAVANLRKAEALKQQGEFSRARRDLQRSMGFGLPDSLAAEILYQMALSSYLEGDAGGAQSFLLQRRHRHTGARTTHIYLLEGLVMLELERWDALREHLLEWLEVLPLGSEVAAGIIDEFDALMKDPGPPALRDPERARLWSTFVPGSGQLYAGSAGWASLNLLSQLTALGGFGLLAYNGYYVASVVIGLGPFQSLYFGGIRQAGTLTERNNKDRQEGFRAVLGEFLVSVARQSDDWR